MNRMPLTMTHYRKKGFAITNPQLRNEVFLEYSALQLTTVKLSWPRSYKVSVTQF